MELSPAASRIMTWWWQWQLWPRHVAVVEATVGEDDGDASCDGDERFAVHTSVIRRIRPGPLLNGSSSELWAALVHASGRWEHSIG